MHESGAVLSFRDARGSGWRFGANALGLLLLFVSVSSLLLAFVGERPTSMVCDRAKGTCVITARPPRTFAAAELSGAKLPYRKTGGRSNREYLRELTVEHGGQGTLLCAVPDGEGKELEPFAAKIDAFVVSSGTPTGGACARSSPPQCRSGRLGRVAAADRPTLRRWRAETTLRCGEETTA